MSPTHSIKAASGTGIYVSHAVVQGRKTKRGVLARVPGFELDATVVAGIRQQLFEHDVSGEVIPNSDRELVERYVDRIIVKLEPISKSLEED